ncbi:hypothetical protein CONLIGDRAFT_680170 [Coniochaeta ligniaria NRRL 30616]|uniref:Uncharacterized protein n=1 Tax=Coniochaeta ligniaria NRRL 30616 TaxID=1408157 RepID=A0A1J7J7R2_9PEZI|nr:hypothetical protein CONLIGDRAFT_680170 [Coniochaeta ligniaria NRRL 30616]
MVKLEKSTTSPWGHKASISSDVVKSIFDKFSIHEGFLMDLLGRPNYWSAVSRIRDGDALEFFCQQPRWSQSQRYDKGKGSASEGHVAPCSVYMRHSKATKLTLYIISTSESEGWFQSLLGRVGIVDGAVKCQKSEAIPLAESPFALHAVVSGASLEGSMTYVASVKDRLMAQIKQVNDYSDKQEAAPTKRLRRNDSDSRVMLENITKELHLVSQTADSGIANAHMAIKLGEKMLADHATFCMGSEPARAVRETHDTLEYVRDSFYCQRDWLTTYKARKDTAMNFVFNMVTQQDTATNVDISYKMSSDSSSMNAITILTMVFLPGTFAAYPDVVLKRGIQSKRCRRYTNDGLSPATRYRGCNLDSDDRLYLVFPKKHRTVSKPVVLALASESHQRGRVCG